MDFGTLDGMAFAEIAPEVVSALLGFETFEAPGGESLESLRQRVTGFLDGLPKGRHMVFTHGGVIRTVGNLVGHRRFVGNTGWMEVSWTERRLIEVSDPAGWRQG
jgi:probable phosphoglycerate mutase